MGIFTGWLRRYSQPRQAIKKAPHEPPRASTQTAVSGGMGSTELLIRLEIVLGDIKSKKPIVKHAYALASLSHHLQARLLADLADLSELSYPHSYEFLSVAADALTGMEQSQYNKWVYDIRNLLHEGYDDVASELIHNHLRYIEAPHIVNLNDVAEILEKLIISIGETDISLIAAHEATHSTAYTDGFQLFLPAKISRFEQYENNYRLYKILTFQLLEQIRLDTWKVLDNLVKATEQYGAQYLNYFSTVETLRINKTIKAAFPGVWRDIESIHKLTAVQYPHALLKNVKLDNAFDSLKLAREFINHPAVLPELVYEPVFLPEKVQQASLSGLYCAPLKETEKLDDKILQTRVERIIHSDSQTRPPDLTESDPELLSEAIDTLSPDLQPMSPDDQSDSLTTTSTARNTGVFYYKEWDTSLQKYKKDWCQVKEITLAPRPEDSVPEPDQSLRYAEFRIKKTLDLLINEQRFMRFQNDGDDIDIDAWVSARSARNKQADDHQNVYIRNNKNSRNVAIMFAVDISGSTRGWKNTAIKHSTWLLCKTLARLDDQYAVYAFSGAGRKHCHSYPIKTFHETCSRSVQSRIYAMQPEQYTRMGAAIRHLGHLLEKTSAKTRILFILTDGKPDDIDSYRGQYAIEDTRRAINEAKALALNPFVLTFDKEGMDYLPHMLGSNRYQLIAGVSQLPLQISAIYKHLTT